ncbi:hypothetical protein Cgig2_028143 [Carnegiea gigantea]|uniref:Uncharacterized protein n=1 Tax=Carnegiea gigantea TaxID=171969 RepID=A0A9Q1JYL6_9CARY|nr:hypothetical protein Cgig2_028143 [Carnegiea gigantea]
MTQENQERTEPSASTRGPLLAPERPCPKCGSERESPIGGPNDPIEEKDAKTNGFQHQYIGKPIGNGCNDQWFPPTIHWTIDAVEQRNKDENESPGEYRRGISPAPRQSCPEGDSERESPIAGPMIQLRVKFRGKRCKDQWFPTTINWTIGIVEQRNKDEREFPGEYGRGETIDRIDYVKIVHEGKLTCKRNRHT